MASRKHNIKLSCTDFTFPLLPHEDSLSLIRMMGMDGVDVGVFGAGSHTRPRDVSANVPGVARRLKAKLRRAGLEPADIYLIPGTERTLAPNHPEARTRRRSREMFKQVLELTCRCGASHMSALPGMPWPNEPRGDALKRSAEELAWRVQQAREVGVVFSIEPGIGSIVSTPSQVQRLLKLTPGLTLTLDFSHFVAQGFSQRDTEPLLEHASHLHVRGARRRRKQASMKDNTIDHERIVRQLKRLGYRGFISFEFEYLDVDPGNEVDTLSETLLLRDEVRKAMAK